MANLLQTIRKRQGWFLIIMILTLVVGDLQIPYYIANPDELKTIYSTVPSWYSLYAVVGLLSNIAIIIGMWRMKKWAAYLLVAYFVSKIAIDLVYVVPEMQAMVFTTTVAGAGLWFWAVYRKWKLFT